MKSKFNNTTKRLSCVVLAIAVLCCSAFALFGTTVAEAKTVNAQETGFNDLTSGSDELFLPNYDTEVITKTLAKPNVTTFGTHDVSYYPSFTNQLSGANFNEDKQAAILAENSQMLKDVKEWYAAGTLKDKLKKHVSADGQFSNANGNYDSAPRIEKVVTVNSKYAARKRSLGVFAPGGEVITIKIDQSLVGKLTVNIGYPYDGECDISSTTDRWKGDRMAQFFLSFALTDTVSYIGSPLGGMITINGVDSNLGNFDITVSGGVDMPDYKLGVSTKEDWQNILAAPGPYVWLLMPHQIFVMPKTEISDIEDPYNALLWWHKASMISMYSMAREDTSHFTTPVITVCDSYVYVGEGVAKVWAFVTNAPKYWCHGMLDYEGLMYNGSWGAIHEYNHHHQAHAYASAEWGVGGSTEVTNNVVSSLSYILLTDIATTRSENNILGVWNGVSDPYCNYRLLNNASANAPDYDKLGASKLFGFVDMMHTFGADKFVDFLRAMYGYGEVEGYDGDNLNNGNYLTTQDGFALFASLFYKTDFTDYFTNVWHFDISDSIKSEIRKKGFSPYFSVNNLYAAGVKGVETGRPYKVAPSEDTTFDFDKYTLSSVDTWQLAEVTKPEHGTLTKNSDGTYTYTPNKNFVDDSFELIYAVTINGKISLRALTVKLVNSEVAAADREALTKSYPAYVDFRNQYVNRWYSNFITSTPATVQCLDNDGNPVKTVNGANINNLIDGNTSTGFHTAWQGTKTAYPHNYYFMFDKQASFNCIDFYFQPGYYAIGEYEIYISDDNYDYTLVKQDVNTGSNFTADLGASVSAKYVKIVVKSNSQNQPFTNITEIQFVQRLDLGTGYNLFTSMDDSLTYVNDKKWTSVTGKYINSQAKHTAKGKVTFYLTGTDLMLYSVNADSKIKIDGKTYEIKANDKNYTPSFIIDGLSNKAHRVEISGVDMTLDMIKTTGTISVSAVNWTGLGISIGVGTGFVSTLVAFIVIVIKQKKAVAN